MTSSTTVPTDARPKSKDLLPSLLESNEGFSVATYLNAALDLNEYPPSQEDNTAEEDDDERLQRRMAELALQLQVQTQYCHDEIGRIGAELRAVLPRCAADLGRLGLGIDGMKEDASSLLGSHLRSSLAHTTTGDNATNPAGDHKPSDGEDSNNGENADLNGSIRNSTVGGDDLAATKTTTASITTSTTTTTTTTPNVSPLETLETLSTLHALRTNMTLTKSILTAAASWDTTMTSIPSLLTPTNTLTDAVSALTTLEAGEKALRGMPGRSERTEAITSIRNQIQILLKPQLLHALQKMETRLGPLQSCVRMYAALGKMESLMEEYVKSRPASIHRLWFEFKSGVKSMHRSGKNLTDDSDRDIDGARKTAADELEFYAPSDQSNVSKDSQFGRMEKENNDGVESRFEEDVVMSDPAKEFIEWLPTWYEAVLLLLSEERRKALVVFGGELAPEIIAKVLNECFRPIMPSFRTRLTAIYPSDADERTQSSSGSIESICATYEATLQFLSVAYEQMVEYEGVSGTSKRTEGSVDYEPARTKTPVQVYVMVRSICIAIGSPFGPYQANFAQLEKKHSELAGRMVSRDIQDAVMSGRAMSLASLQDSVERLSGLAPFMFPLAQAAIARFESLCSGYWAPNALSTIDSFLSRHIGEISIAVDTLSTTLFSNQNNLTKTFDEQQVLCALEVLKIAGVIRKDLGSFQEKARDRFRVLAGRMSATIDQEAALMDAIMKGSRCTSLVPDTLSAVDIEALLAKVVCGDTDDVTKSPEVSKLQSLASADPTNGDIMPLFPNSIDTTARFVRICQSFVFDVCSAVPLKHLNNMTALPIWREGHSMFTTTSDSYGTLPQPYITQVGEHMLALVQALEPFASNEDALQLTNGVMDKIEHVSLQPWKEFANISNCANSSDSEAISLLASGRDIREHVLSESLQSFDEEEEDCENDDSNNVSAVFCNRWLDAICSAVTGRLLERTMQIQHVSRKGCEHLTADYDYLINVFFGFGRIRPSSSVLESCCRGSENG